MEKNGCISNRAETLMLAILSLEGNCRYFFFFSFKFNGIGDSETNGEFSTLMDGLSRWVEVSLA